MRKGIRVCAIVLFILSTLFGIDLPWTEAQPLGETIFSYLQLGVYSNGTEGWYYPGILSIIGQFSALVIFSITTEKKLKMLNYLLSWYLLTAVILWAIGSFI